MSFAFDQLDKFILGARIRGVTIVTQGYPTWGPEMKTTWELLKLARINIAYSWSARQAGEVSAFGDLRPDRWRLNGKPFTIVSYKPPPQTTYLAMLWGDDRGIIGSKKDRRWEDYYCSASYLSADDCVNVRVFYMETQIGLDQDDSDAEDREG